MLGVLSEEHRGNPIMRLQGQESGLRLSPGPRAHSEAGPHQPPWPRAAVNLGVFRQVVTAGELLVAEGAAVRLHAGMGASVTGQLVGARESEGRRDTKKRLTITTGTYVC